MKTIKNFFLFLFLFGFSTVISAQIHTNKSIYEDFTFNNIYTQYYTKPISETQSILNNVKLLFDNKNVRISEIYFNPNETISVAPTSWKSMLVLQNDADFTDTNGTIIFDTRKLSKTLKQEDYMYEEPKKTHQITNVSTTKVLRLIRVEIKE